MHLLGSYHLTKSPARDPMAPRQVSALRQRMVAMEDWTMSMVQCQWQSQRRSGKSTKTRRLERWTKVDGDWNIGEMYGVMMVNDG